MSGKHTMHVTMPRDKALEYLESLERLVNDQLDDVGYAIALGMAIREFRAAEPDDAPLTCEELRTLKEAEAQGRLVVLPCKTGDKIYNTASLFSRLQEPKEHIVEGFSVWRGEGTIICRGGVKFGVKTFGKTVFLTREEAEAALSEGSGEDNPHVTDN